MVIDSIDSIGEYLFSKGIKVEVGEWDSKKEGIFINDYITMNEDQYSKSPNIQLTVKKCNVNNIVARKEAKQRCIEIFNLISEHFYTRKQNEIFLGTKNNTATYIINFETEEARL